MPRPQGRQLPDEHRRKISESNLIAWDVRRLSNELNDIAKSSESGMAVYLIARRITPLATLARAVEKWSRGGVNSDHDSALLEAFRAYQNQ